MWVSKKKDERRKEFIVAALELFVEKGYEKTSINDILKKIGITKGSFYHNFESKEDLLVKVVDVLAEDIVCIVREIAEKEVPSIDALRELASKMILYRQENELIYSALKAVQEDSKNTLIAKMLRDRIMENTRGYIYQILRQGQLQGVFTIVDEEMVSELYITLLMAYKEKIGLLLEQTSDRDSLKKQLNKLEQIYAGMIGSVLGIEGKAIDFLSVNQTSYLESIKNVNNA